MGIRTEQSPAARQAAQAAARAHTLRRWERLRAHGRSYFIWRNGVVGWGLPAAMLTAIYKVVQEQGLAWPPTIAAELQHALALIVVVFPVLGYLFGSWLWTQGEAQYDRLREDDAGAGTPHRPPPPR